MEIVILCNRKDFYLAKVCVASIRHFYPEIKVSLLKDYTNGSFNTAELERYFEVGILNLGIKKYGWGIAKIHAMISNVFEAGTKVLLLDADIVFIGRVIDELDKLIENDFIVHPEYIKDARENFVKNTYFDIDKIIEIEPNYTFPGYTFNTGQIVITAGKLKDTDFIKYLDFNTPPYWKEHKSFFPLADQSLLNVILHNKEAKGEISVGKVHFNKYPGWHEYKNISVKDIKANNQPFLMHWAGCKRVAAFKYMSHPDILFYMKREYYIKFPYGLLRYHSDNLYQSIKHNLLGLARKMKRFS